MARGGLAYGGQPAGHRVDRERGGEARLLPVDGGATRTSPVSRCSDGVTELPRAAPDGRRGGLAGVEDVELVPHDRHALGAVVRGLREHARHELVEPGGHVGASSRRRGGTS